MISRSASDRLLERYKYELTTIPEHLVKFISDNGASVYLLTRATNAASVGTIRISTSPDGRSTANTSCVQMGSNKLILYDFDVFGEDINIGVFSVIQHEFGHLLDRALGFPLYYSKEDYLKGGSPLDTYAATSQLERFATAFHAYLTPDEYETEKKKTNYSNTYTHTRSELKQREPRLYEYIHAICTAELSDIRF